MKKNKRRDQEQKPRRLGLNRETIRALDPALLLARGGETEATYTCNFTTNTDTGSDVYHNCYPTTCSVGTTTTDTDRP